MTPSVILDSYAILSYLEKEPGGYKVKEILEKAKDEKVYLFLSIINLAEVYYQTIRGYGSKEGKVIISIVKRMPLTIVPASEDLVFRVAEIKAENAISLADCFVVALADDKRASILTGDPEFKKVEELVKIIWL